MTGDPANAQLWLDADVYVAPIGTALPASAGDAFPAGWELVGLLSGDDGMTQSRSEDRSSHYAWGGVLTRTSRKNFGLTEKFTALEDNDTTRSLIWPGSTATAIYVPVPGRVLFAYELREGSKVRRRITAQYAEVDLTGDVTQSESDLTAYELTATIYPNGDGVLYVEQSTDAAELVVPLLPALARYRAALAERDTDPVTILVLADSVSEGQGASTIGNRWPTLLQNDLRAAYPAAGSTGGAAEPWIPAWRSVWAPDSPWADAGITQTGGMTSSTYGAFGQHTADLVAGAVRTWAFTGTRAYLWFANWSGNTFTYRIDGGAPQTVQTSTSGEYSRTLAYTGASGAHTIAVTGGAGGTSVLGVEVFNGDETRGIRVYNGAHSGYRADQFVDDSGSNAPAHALVMPDLVIVELGGNDAGAGRAVAAYKADIQTIIAEQRAAITPDPSFLLIGVYDPDHTGQVHPWTEYRDALAEIAADNPADVAFLDLSATMPAATASDVLYSSDNLHPSDVGMATIEAAVFEALAR